MESQNTRDMDKNRDNDRNKDAARHEPYAGSGGGMGMNQRSGGEQGRDHDNGAGDSTLDQAKSMARSAGEQARSMATSAASTAQDLARRAREQTGAATDTLYQQGAQASEYLTRNVNEYPLAALLIAGAVGYGLGYLIHSQWTSGDWGNGERRRDDGNNRQ